MASAQVQHDARVIGSLVAGSFPQCTDRIFAPTIRRRTYLAIGTWKSAEGKPPVRATARRSLHRLKATA
jgi:hypothetical protein